MNLQLTSGAVSQLEGRAADPGLLVASRSQAPTPNPTQTWEQSLRGLIRKYGAAICPDSIGYDNSVSNFINGRAGDLSHLGRGARASAQFRVTGLPNCYQSD